MDERFDLTGATAAHRAFATALRRGDAAAVSALYTESAWLLAPAAAPIRGRTAIEQYWQTGVDAGVRDVDLEPVRFETRRDVIYELGRYAVAVERDGPVADRGDYLLVHERQDDGSWRWAVEMFNPDAPIARPEQGRES